mmetsp:Transcript_9803/g.19258  ORF Transcript_9803/g.19258 Transcript_9803/m.19258 type:complete len:351 (-) Transcript_9803:243-1295(-)
MKEHPQHEPRAAPIPPTQAAGHAPKTQAVMHRGEEYDEGEDYVDPVRVLTSLQESQLHDLTKMNVKELSRFMSDLNLREIPRQIQRHGLNGSILHTITAKDIDKMDFDLLGEAKAFENLCSSISSIEREQHRSMLVRETPLTFWGVAHEWHSGPLSSCNRCAMKDHRGVCLSCWDSLCCNPVQFVELPPSVLRIYRDHITIEYARWKDHIKDKYRKMNHAYAETNEPPYKVVEDNIDFTMIVDLDVEIIQKQDDYKRSCADCTNFLCCKELKRQPNKGDFYWVNVCQQLCGYDLFYEESAEGYLTITLRHDADQEGNVRKIGVLQGVEEAAKSILHFMEEAQMVRTLRIH